MSAVLNPARAVPAPPAIQQLHHYAYRARDAEETRHFYEDVLGLPLYHIIQSDYVPSTGEYCPYTHFFFRLQDGSFIAFFDLGDDQAAEPSPNTPLWVNHILYSIYFFDPNGIRLELTAQLADEFQMLQESKTAHARLAEWTARKEHWRKDRATGKSTEALKPQQNDRPEFVKKP